GLPSDVVEDITWHNCFRFLGVAPPAVPWAPSAAGRPPAGPGHGPIYDDHRVGLREIHEMKNVSSVNLKGCYQAGDCTRPFATLGSWWSQRHAPPAAWPPCPGHAPAGSQSPATRCTPATRYRSPGREARCSGRHVSC